LLVKLDNYIIIISEFLCHHVFAILSTILTPHFSLRTSETNYLNEAYSFYAAIRGRAYYSRACKEDRPDLMVKKLRYYARFIVVCLLLKKMKLVRELVIELERQIQEYTQT
jgi:hypothetical protein